MVNNDIFIFAQLSTDCDLARAGLRIYIKSYYDIIFKTNNTKYVVGKGFMLVKAGANEV